MYIKKIHIENFKCFRNFDVEFDEHINIIVGNNNEGKSTILEAVHLALSGMINGQYLRSDISEYLFNKKVVDEYKNEDNIDLPNILIEIYLQGDECPLLQGNGNTKKENCCGISYKICFNEEYNAEYNELVKFEGKKILPVEYYKIERTSFARDLVTSRSIPLKSIIIDSTSNRFRNGSDVYISKIIQDNLSTENKIKLSRSYKKLKDDFINDDNIKQLNERLKNDVVSSGVVSISADMSINNSWDDILITEVDEIPFTNVGKGEQCIIKTNLALDHDKAINSNVILLEEPENHLSYGLLNKLTKQIKDKCYDKQLIMTTHSNFIANKLGLNNLIFLSNQSISRLTELNKEDVKFFEKLSGYDTLRIILSDSSILVEGPSDELIVEKAYMDGHNGRAPIEDDIDIINVRGLSFKRYLDLAKLLKKKVAVVTDNDGNYLKNIENKYQDYKSIEGIRIFASEKDKLNTLEPQFLDVNKENIINLSDVIEHKYISEDEFVSYMINNKTEWAYKIYCSEIKFTYPQYILDAIKWVTDGK